MASNLVVQIQVPLLNKENYEKRCIQIKALFGLQDVWEIENSWYTEPTPKHEATNSAN